MSGKRFEDYKPIKDERPPNHNCSTCEHYFQSSCDGLRGWCSSYKAYRSKTLEDLVLVAIGTTVCCSAINLIATIVVLFMQ